MTRAEHLEWCKKRAREYLDDGDVKNAVTSMLSDLSKHPETKDMSMGGFAQVGIHAIMRLDVAFARRFIEGFR